MKANEEFIEHTKESKSKVKCAFITLGDSRWDEEKKRCVLRCGYSEQDFQSFIKSLNFIYDSGYGGQELFGHIWYEDGTWSSRGEYDGSEWWEYNTRPTIPTECL